MYIHAHVPFIYSRSRGLPHEIKDIATHNIAHRMDRVTYKSPTGLQCTQTIIFPDPAMLQGALSMEKLFADWSP